MLRNGAGSFVLLASELMRKGTEITVGYGPFLGLTGVVISCQRGRVVVRIEHGKRTFLIELEEDMIKQHPPKQSAKPAVQ